jgi:hypothetical protein
LAKVYTDNDDMLFIGVEMLLKGIAIWQSMCDCAIIWRAPEAIMIRSAPACSGLAAAASSMAALAASCPPSQLQAAARH